MLLGGDPLWDWPTRRLRYAWGMQEPPRSWLHFDEWLSRESRALRAAGIEPFSLPAQTLDASTLDEIVDHLADAVGTHAHEIGRRIVDHLPARHLTGPIDYSTVTPEAAQVFALQLQIVTEWVSSLKTSGNGLCESYFYEPLIFPTQIEFRDFVYWLFDRWWDENGLQRAADDMALSHKWPEG